MAATSAPYIYIQCPCSDNATTPEETTSPATQSDLDQDDYNFHPRNPRLKYSLYPLEHLLFCEDCNQLRCPRCVTEETVAYYCPNCLFEVPGSNVKADGTRCTRSCFECPICLGILTITDLASTSTSTATLQPPSDRQKTGPYSLSCTYCSWTSTEVGLSFEKPQGIYAQLQKKRNGGKARVTSKERKQRQQDAAVTTVFGTTTSSATLTSIEEGASEKLAPSHKSGRPDIDSHFSNLRTFYTSQMADANGSNTGLGGLNSIGLNSPASLTRIMNMYTGGGGLVDKKSKTRIKPMREAREDDEGFCLADLDETDQFDNLMQGGWEQTTSELQASAQIANVVEPVGPATCRFLESLRPIPIQLRTKRSKRCSTCRHIISKPESKITSTRFRIRLIAGNYIPSITIRPLQTADAILTPLKTVQYLLTFRNPIFENIKVNLATPATTTGRFASRVTVLCPQFEVDANTDVWDEALKDTGLDDRKRRDDGSQGGQPEAGKIWKRGRNWVSVVVEIVPASLDITLLPVTEVDKASLRHDENILEIPMFVRIEWEAEAAENEPERSLGKDKSTRVKKELAYWCALGIGEITKG